ncbi:Hypothetical predicted protein [Podarcis lilfordi]|uniref:Uncharacterized protein n=1 Tax=Podarcis lilfordi TaxID=74358 RepID=A0AA35KSS2_9SAUR|nr:Hypothetical predicted protein [Podarcis lilfordi]
MFVFSASASASSSASPVVQVEGQDLLHHRTGFWTKTPACCAKSHSQQWVQCSTTVNIIGQHHYSSILSTPECFCFPVKMTGNNCMPAQYPKFHHFTPKVFWVNGVAHGFFSWNQ